MSRSLVPASRPLRRHEAERDGGEEARGGATPDARGRDGRLSTPEVAVRGREVELRPPHPHPRKARQEEMIDGLGGGA